MSKEFIVMRDRFPKLPPAPPPSSVATSASMKGNRSKGTAAEKKLAKILISKGLTRYSENDGSLPGSPDFAFRDSKLAVFVNGCYWHRCPYCKPNFPKSNQEYWEVKFKRNRIRDRRNKSVLRSMGWKSLVVWECKLDKNPASVGSRIERALGMVSG